VVDMIVDGALDAADHFGGRPPELFSGIARTEAPMPIAYPSSCSPQAWASASVLLLVRAMLDLNPSTGPTALSVDRRDLSGLGDLTITGLRCRGSTFSVGVNGGVARVSPVA
jgi:glycogen debranching enzyme